MIDIDDKDFFDTIYAGFTQTTRAADTFWMSEKDHEDSWNIWAVGQDESRTIIASDLYEVDADFITAVHGCFPDLVRRLHAALDEADRADREHDEREQEIGRLSLENQELQGEIDELVQKNDELTQTIATARSKAADVLWKSERWT